MNRLPMFLFLSLCLSQFLPWHNLANPKPASAGQLRSTPDYEAAGSECLRQGAVVDFERYKNPDQGQQGTVEDKTGLVFAIQPQRCPDSREWCGARLTISYQGKKVKDLQTDGWFTGYARYDRGSEHYFVIEDFSGGAHCCVSQHFLFLSDSQPSVRFLGDLALEHGGPGGYEKNLLCRNGRNFLKIPDWRFAYFYTSFAQSFPFMKFYLLTPAGLHLDNQAFRDFYLKGLTEINQNIQKAISHRADRPTAILSGQGQNALLSDDLAVLLVERTVHLLCAREDARAWQDLQHDVQKYYRTTNGLALLQRQIKQTMANAPY